MSLSVEVDEPVAVAGPVEAVARAVREGLTGMPKQLPPWLFYDERGSQLFEAITELPEYSLTRTERALLERYSDQILLHLGQAVTVVELGAGTATKTGVLLEAATRFQQQVVYQPVDVSASALAAAKVQLEARLPGVEVRPQLANYVTDNISLARPAGAKILAMYIGSSIGNFSPDDAQSILAKLRAKMSPGDALLLGTDLAPSPKKPVAALLAAYDDAAGVTAEFNRNMLVRLNRELGTDFRVACFKHRARWNTVESRIEMHLESLHAQTVTLPADAAGSRCAIHFTKGETIHTENSYKFTEARVRRLLADAGFAVDLSFQDPDQQFALTLGAVV